VESSGRMWRTRATRGMARLAPPRRRWRAYLVLVLIGLVSTSTCLGPVPAREHMPAAAAAAPAGRAASARSIGTLVMPTHWSAARPLSLADLANEYIARMSLDEQLGQLFLADFVGTAYDANNAGMVEQYHAGGIILYASSIQSVAQARALVAAAQAHATFPLLVAIDEEGGWVDRMQQIYGFRPSASMIGANGSPAFAYSQGLRVARDMRSLGLNFDFAPDVDVQLVDGPDQSTRTFGSTPQAVSTLAGAYLRGMEDGGVVGSLKHFPGLGAATTDAHLGLPVINRSRDQLEAVELAPYRTLLASGQVQAIMTTDLLMPALDPTQPAELSPAIITGVLRDELGFDGVVVTDALYMDGVAQRYSMPDAGVQAILAGDDLLVGPWTPDQMGAMMQALRDAVASGRISKARIDDSVRRILILKMRMGLIPVPAAVVAAVPPLGTMTPATIPGAQLWQPPNGT
jgi:beta-N-acetylhexosaminidase